MKVYELFVPPACPWRCYVAHIDPKAEPGGKLCVLAYFRKGGKSEAPADSVSGKGPSLRLKLL